MEFMSVGDCAFRVLRLMGKWKGSYSYLVEDDKGTYVLKQIHHEPCDYYQFSDKFALEMQDDYLRQMRENVQTSVRSPNEYRLFSYKLCGSG